MDNVLCPYCDRSCFKHYSEELFLRWLVDVLGPVLSGVKPSEVLSFKNCDTHSQEKVATIKQYLSSLPTLGCRMHAIADGSTKVLFFHREALERQLNQKVVREFIAGEGYSVCWDLDGCITELLSRFENRQMPHEIGVFLGYPLKDVLGFIGKAKLVYKKTQGWQVYGDPTLSDKVYNQFMQARADVRRRLQCESPFEILTCA